MTDRSFFVTVTHALAGYIEQELGMARGAHFRFARVVPSYKVLSLWLVINPTYTKRVMAMTREMSQAARLAKGAFIRAEWGGQGVVELQVPKPPHLCTAPKTGELPQQSGIRTAIGFNTENQAAWTDFANPVTAHTLIAGLSGCGKTNLGRLLAYLLAAQNRPEEVQLLLVDVADSGLAWRGFGKLPHLVGNVVADDKTTLDALAWATGEMQRRVEARETTPRLFIMVDEIQELSKQPRFVEPIEALARRGRKWGMNLVLATQRPTKDSMGSMTVKANMGLRIVGKVTSGQEAAWATDLAESGADALVGAGDFLLVESGGNVQRIAVPFLGDDDLASLPTDGHGHIDFTVIGAEDTALESATGFDALETALSLLAAHHGKGRPWLKDILGAETKRRPGSKRADRLLAWGRETNGLLRRYGHRLALTL